MNRTIPEYFGKNSTVNEPVSESVESNTIEKFVIEDVIMKDNEKLEPCLVQFSNGVIKKNTKVEGKLYRNASEIFIRRRRERMLKASTHSLSYVGKNFGEDVSNLFQEKRFLGVLDKKTNTVKLLEMSSFMLHPQLQTTLNSSTNESFLYSSMTPKEKYKKLRESFGGRKGRSIIRKRAENEVAIENMSSALQDAFETVEQLDELAEEDEGDPYGSIIPPRDMKATSATEVYQLENIITDEELVLFNDYSVACIEGEVDMSEYSLLFNQTLANAKLTNNEETTAKLCCVALFNEYLMELLRKKSMRKEAELNHCPKIIKAKIFAQFTDGKLRKLTKLLEDKLIAHIIVLALIANKFEIEWTTLCRSILVTNERLEQLVKVVGATFKKKQGIVVLKLPLVIPVVSLRRRKK